MVALKISVIVPNYNHFPFLKQRIESVLNQTYQEFELILLDDCSTDGSWQYLKQYECHPKVSHCIQNKSNSGSPFKQWKKGIELAKGDWIWIAESDDFSNPKFLEAAISNIRDNTALSFVRSNKVSESSELLGDLINWDIRDSFRYNKWLSSFSMSGYDFVNQFLKYRNVIPNASGAIFKAQSTFPNEIESMSFSGDWFFWVFVLKNGACSYLSTPLNNCRHHSISTTSKKTYKLEKIRLNEGLQCIAYARKFVGDRKIKSKDYRYYYLPKYWRKVSRKFGIIIFLSGFLWLPSPFNFLYFRSFFKRRSID